jgi:hypothetical protein
VLFAFDLLVADDREVSDRVVAYLAGFGISGEVADCGDLKHEPKNLETIWDRACFVVHCLALA